MTPFEFKTLSIALPTNPKPTIPTIIYKNNVEFI